MIIAILDTSVTVDLIRALPAALSWFATFRRQQVAITPVVWMEMVQGATDKQRRDSILRFLRDFPIEHPTLDDNRWAMRQLAAYNLSDGVTFPDVMIASVAARLSVPLYTLNVKHYVPLSGLDVRRPY